MTSSGSGDRSRRVRAVARALTAGRRRRFALAVAAVLILLAGAKVVTWFGPVGTGLVAGPVIAALLVLLARGAGLSWDDLGLGRRAVRRGALWAGIACWRPWAVTGRRTGWACCWPPCCGAGPDLQRPGRRAVSRGRRWPEPDHPHAWCATARRLINDRPGYGSLEPRW